MFFTISDDAIILASFDFNRANANRNKHMHKYYKPQSMHVETSLLFNVYIQVKLDYCDDYNLVPYILDGSKQL